MLVGILAALIVAGINIPLARGLSRAIGSPWGFLGAYLVLGLFAVVVGYFVISLVFVPNPQTYVLVALLAYGSVGGNVFKEKRLAQRQQ